MAESWIKIKATANEMEKNFYNENLSEFYFIKYFKAKNYNGKDDVPIVYETMIRHNEIGNRTIGRSSPYTFETLEKTLAEKVKEYKQEQISIEETITSISKLDSKNCFTVARVMEGEKCVELHYNEGKAYIEYGTKVAEDVWENEINEDVKWFNINLTDNEVLDYLNKEFDEHFLEKETNLDLDY